MKIKLTYDDYNVLENVLGKTIEAKRKAGGAEVTIDELLANGADKELEETKPIIDALFFAEWEYEVVDKW